ncbi:sensor histidine kinase [Microbacterium halophytorum]|uniref:sensor histidine kinase n=1 Tax=Microbacterium halophytorum TaxID=2067568 RepID=UPI001319E5B2|nr:ATP-binding protein [Microbacterium halophytorum]
MAPPARPSGTAPRRRSVARTYLVVHTVVLLAAGAAVLALLAVDARQTARAEAEATTDAFVDALDRDPFVREAAADAYERTAEGIEPRSAIVADASAQLQPYVEEIIATGDVDYVTIMHPDRTRYTHADPDEIGGPFVGTIEPALEGRTVTEVYEGTLGASLRTTGPVVEGGEVVGLVSAGVLLRDVSAAEVSRLVVVGGVTLLFVASGIVAMFAMFRRLDRVTDSRAPGELRAAFDEQRELTDVRTIADALRAQVHETDNRLHTIASLIELGRTDEALELATDRLGEGQRLMDRVVGAPDQPVIAALMLGKSAQAHELGVEMHFETHLEPGTQGLDAGDVVTILGNLLDNAIDAAAAARREGTPPWVEAYLATDEAGELTFQVSDSGAGVPPAERERIFRRGVSSKGDGDGRHGYGLALVERTVSRLGGGIEVGEAAGGGAEFTVILPRGAD